MSNVNNRSGGADDDHRHADHGDGGGHVHGSDHRGAAGDDHHHDHGGAGHVYAPASFGKAFAIGITLNTALVVVGRLVVPVR